MSNVHRLPVRKQPNRLLTEEQAREIHQQIIDDQVDGVQVEIERANWQQWYRGRSEIDHPLGWHTLLAARVGQCAEALTSFELTGHDPCRREAERACLEIAAVALELRACLRRGGGQ